jgi:hypothetical protein
MARLFPFEKELGFPRAVAWEEYFVKGMVNVYPSLCYLTLCFQARKLCVVIAFAAASLNVHVFS